MLNSCIERFGVSSSIKSSVQHCNSLSHRRASLRYVEREKQHVQCTGIHSDWPKIPKSVKEYEREVLTGERLHFNGMIVSFKS